MNHACGTPLKLGQLRLTCICVLLFASKPGSVLHAPSTDLISVSFLADCPRANEWSFLHCSTKNNSVCLLCTPQHCGMCQRTSQPQHCGMCQHASQPQHCGMCQHTSQHIPSAPVQGTAAQWWQFRPQRRERGLQAAMPGTRSRWQLNGCPCHHSRW